MAQRLVDLFTLPVGIAEPHTREIIMTNLQLNHRVITGIFGIFIFILVACVQSPTTPTINSEPDPKPNQAPTIISVYIADAFVLWGLIHFDETYQFRCTAIDSDDTALTYTWIFTYENYDPLDWVRYSDTLVTDTDRVSYHTHASGDLEIACIVTDSSGARDEGHVAYRVELPHALYDHNWECFQFLAMDSMPFIPVSPGYYLNFSIQSYYGIVTPCVTQFGEASLNGDTLSLFGLQHEIYADTCGSDSSAPPLWNLIGWFRYQYWIDADTLSLGMYDDTTSLAFWRFVAVSDTMGRVALERQLDKRYRTR